MKAKKIALVLSALALTAVSGYLFGQYEAEKIQTAQVAESENTTYSIKFPNLREMNGVYSNSIIETEDGNFWFYNDTDLTFHNGEEVTVLFDCEAPGIEDDIILDVHSLEY